MIAHSYPTTPKRQRVDSKIDSKFERPDEFDHERDSLALSKAIDVDDYWVSVFATNSVHRTTDVQYFDQVMLKNKALKTESDAALKQFVQSCSTLVPENFVEFSLPTPVLELIKMPDRPPKFKQIEKNIWKARKSEHRLNIHGEPLRDDDSDTEGGTVCNCHVNVPGVLLKQWQKEARAKQAAAAAASEASNEPAEEIPEVTPEKPVVQGVKRGRASSPSRTPTLPTSRQLSMQNQVQIDKYIHNRAQQVAVPEVDADEEQEKELLEMGADKFALRHFGSHSEMQKACCGESCINRICFTECSPDVCPLADKCQNQRIRRKQNADVEPRPTFDKGWGLFSNEALTTNQFILEYCGELIDNEECERRIMEALKEGGHRHLYHMVLTDQLVIDATYSGSPARFLNHSCEPNCTIQNWVVGRERHIGVFASRPIKKNEELTIDYQYARVQGKNAVQQICYCGAASCQGFIGWKQTDKKGQKSKKNGKPSVVNSAVTKVAAVEEFRETDCFSCQRSGVVMTCSGRLGGAPCPKVYHPRCVQQKDVVKRWICPWHVCHGDACLSQKTVTHCIGCSTAWCQRCTPIFHVKQFEIQDKNINFVLCEYCQTDIELTRKQKHDPTLAPLQSLHWVPNIRATAECQFPMLTQQHTEKTEVETKPVSNEKQIDASLWQWDHGHTFLQSFTKASNMLREHSRESFMQISQSDKDEVKRTLFAETAPVNQSNQSNEPSSSVYLPAWQVSENQIFHRFDERAKQADADRVYEKHSDRLHEVYSKALLSRHM